MAFGARPPLVVAALVLVAAAACGGGAKQYELTGQVLAVRAESREILIKHQDIPNFMPGMTMPFKVRDAALLDQVAPGDLVVAQLMVAPTEAWIASVTKTGSAPLPDTPPPATPASGVTVLRPGDEAPVTALEGSDGQPVGLADFRGSAVAVTFIYTSCPLPQFCPLMDRRFAEIQRTVADTPALAGRVRLLSVSFDPDTDTPARLRAHATSLGADPAVWHFATAPRDAVDRFAAAFGVNVIREADGTITHNLRTATIGPDGRVIAIRDGNEWTPEQVVADLTHALAGS
ncbi:MAG: SCO family protein [Vicinamibacterales bacterium]